MTTIGKIRDLNAKLAADLEFSLDGPITGPTEDHLNKVSPDIRNLFTLEERQWRFHTRTVRRARATHLRQLRGRSRDFTAQSKYDLAASTMSHASNLEDVLRAEQRATS